MNMEQKFCQSCGMPLTDKDKGINADGSRNDDYCNYCYMDGRFTQDFTMEQMIEHCARFTDDINKWSGENMTVEQAKEMMRQFYPNLKRWKNKYEILLYGFIRVRYKQSPKFLRKHIRVGSLSKLWTKYPVLLRSGFTAEFRLAYWRTQRKSS